MEQISRENVRVTAISTVQRHKTRTMHVLLLSNSGDECRTKDRMERMVDRRNTP